MNSYRCLTVSRARRMEGFLCWDLQTCHGKFSFLVRSFKLKRNLICREIDQAFLRRFERKILIDVPSFSERQNLIKHYLPPSQYWRAEDLEELALLSENFTGDDIRVAVKEANMMIIRKRIRNSEKLTSVPDLDVEFHHLKDSLKQIKPNPENEIVKHRQWNTSC